MAEDRNGIKSNLAALRQLRGIGASELAKAAGISRQTIYSIENGSYTPNTSVALRLARYLDTTVEQLFELEDESVVQPETVIADLISASIRVYPGQPVQVCRVGTKWVALPEASDEQFLGADPNTRVASGNEQNSRIIKIERPLASETDILLAGCDPAVGLLRGMVQSTSYRLVPWFANSSRSLELLKAGLVHIAGFHVSDQDHFLRSQLPDGEYAVVRYVQWQEGLVTAYGNPKHLRRPADLLNPNVRMVNREPGSGSRATLDAALKAAKITGPALPGYADVVTSHLAVARRVRDGAADCGIATESAALLLGLSFIPLAAHRYDLVLRRQHLDLPQIKALLDSLHRSTFLRRLHGMCAYEVGTTGAVIPVESGLEKR